VATASRLRIVTAVKRSVSKSQGKAQATRARIVGQAYALFCDLGYRSTTMELIAERAGVAVQTVYFAFRTKDDLLQAVHEWTVFGDGPPLPPVLQEWHLRAMQEIDAPRALRKIVAGIASLDARMAPMLPVFNAVSQDAAGAIHQRSEELRRQGMAQLVDVLARRTPLAHGMTRRRAGDLLHVLTGPESYRAFVLDSGWPERDWVRWVSNTLSRELFVEA